LSEVPKVEKCLGKYALIDATTKYACAARPQLEVYIVLLELDFKIDEQFD
jgi:hypothetical protein